jgi:hypothetical protein
MNKPYRFPLNILNIISIHPVKDLETLPWNRGVFLFGLVIQAKDSPSLPKKRHRVTWMQEQKK